MRSIALPEHPLLAVGVVESDVVVGETPPELAALLSGSDVPEPFTVKREDRQAVYDGIRKLLRHTGYKPSGRGKPASELLAKMHDEGGVPSINNIVDINNVVSLYSGIPISVFDAELLDGDLHVAPGGEGESYVFNASGHELKLEGLLTVYHRGIPAGNGVRDSMTTKVHDGTTRIVAVLYSNHEVVADTYLRAACDWYVRLLSSYASAIQPRTTTLLSSP